MDWTTVRNRKTAIVHATFAIPAIYTSPEGVVTPCNVRRHPEMKAVGDPQDEGFAVRVQNINELVFDTTEVTPKRNGVVVFSDDGSTYEVLNLLPPEGTMQPAEVALQ